MPLTYGSLFAGAGGADLGLDAAGMVCRWRVEIDPAAAGVLLHHAPDVPTFADVRLVGAHCLEPVDVIVGGFPCQDLSVAGARRGLEGARSGLFFDLLRITNELRPRILLWENVPGLLSSQGGRDLHLVLSALAEHGYFGAYRVLDAQWFGVAQRRRRVFGVFADGHSGAEHASEILALAEGLRRDPAPRRGSRARSPGAPSEGDRGDGVVCALSACGVGTCGADDNQAQAGHLVTGTLSPGAHPGGFNGQDAFAGLLVAHALRGEGFDASEDGTGRGTPIVLADPLVAKEGDPCHPMSASARPPAIAFRSEMGGNDGGVYDDGTTSTMTKAPVAVAFQPGFVARGVGSRPNKDVFPTLGATTQGDQAPHVAVSSGRGWWDEGKACAQTLQSQESLTKADTLVISPHHASGVRRLTPRECERLQGWPDDHTLLRAPARLDGNRWIPTGEPSIPQADGPRYRQIGNGIAAPCAAWIARRIVHNLCK